MRPSSLTRSTHCWNTDAMSGSRPDVGSSNSSSSASDASAATERDLLTVALGVGASLLRRVQVELLDQVCSPLFVQPAPEPAEQVDDLTTAEVRPEVHVAGDVGEAAVQVHGVGPRVAVEQPDLAGIGAQEAQEDPNGRGLAGTVRPDEPVDLAGIDGEVQAVEGTDVAEGLDEARHIDRGSSSHGFDGTDDGDADVVTERPCVGAGGSARLG